MSEKTNYPLKDFLAFARTLNFARQNRFEMTITLPQSKNSAGFRTKWMKSTRKFDIMIEDTALPGRSMETARLRINANFEQRVRAVDYFGEAINFTFLVDDTWEIKQFIEDWQDLMVNYNERTVGFYEDYIGKIEIRTLSIDDTTRHIVVLEEAFPRSFQILQTTQASGAIHRLTVAFAFKRWHTERVANTNGTNTGNPVMERTVADNKTNAAIQGDLGPKPRLPDPNYA